MGEKIRILQNFRYGSVSDPQRMTAGNVQEIPEDATEHQVHEWLRLGWVERVVE